VTDLVLAPTAHEERICRERWSPSSALVVDGCPLPGIQQGLGWQAKGLRKIRPPGLRRSCPYLPLRAPGWRNSDPAGMPGSA
jgi:hypothetical protein